MPKGKKFDAAEKHFENKCIEWRKKIRELEQVNKILHKKICDNCDEIEKLQMENEYLKQQNEVLMEIKEMSVDDVKTLIKSKESINNISDLFNAMTQKMF
jgi:predicted RNase H-like nuclease (RuvC/YqgF family)